MQVMLDYDILVPSSREECITYKIMLGFQSPWELTEDYYKGLPNYSVKGSVVKDLTRIMPTNRLFEETQRILLRH